MPSTCKQRSLEQRSLRNGAETLLKDVGKLATSSRAGNRHTNLSGYEVGEALWKKIQAAKG